MIAAVEAGDWNRAADEAINSTWHSQTPTRSTHLANVFRNQTSNYPSIQPPNKPVSTYDAVPGGSVVPNYGYSGPTYDTVPNFTPPAPTGPNWGDSVYAPSPGGFNPLSPAPDTGYGFPSPSPVTTSPIGTPTATPPGYGAAPADDGYCLLYTSPSPRDS